MKLTWYDGGLMPPKPEEIGDEKLNGEGGMLYIGTKGKMLQDTYGAKPRLLPESLHNSLRRAEREAAAYPARGARDELGRTRSRARTRSRRPFEYAAQLTEIMLLGVVSLRAGGKITTTGRQGRSRIP